MRFVDLAVAGMIGISSLGLLIVWNPQANDLAAGRALERARLRDLLVRFVDREGLVSLQQSPPGQICEKFSALTNATLQVEAEIGSYSCGAPPPPYSNAANLTMALGPREVSLLAWFGAKP
jgi:hypothetical protein